MIRWTILSIIIETIFYPDNGKYLFIEGYRAFKVTHSQKDVIEHEKRSLRSFLFGATACRHAASKSIHQLLDHIDTGFG